MENGERRRVALAAFMHKHGLNRTAWARASGVSEASLREFMNGKTDSIGIAAYEALAANAGVTVSTLLGQTVPVVARVGAGQEVYPIDDHSMGEGLEQVDTPPGVMPGEVVAVAVSGDSMYPALRENWLLFYRRETLGVAEDCINALCVCQVEDGPTFVKEVRRGSEPGLFNLISWNAPPKENVRLTWAARVLDIRPR